MGRISATLIALFLLAGCASVSVKTNGYLDAGKLSEGFATQTSFSVLPNKDARNLLLDEEIRKKIQNHFIHQGYMITNTEEAQYTVTYSYSMDSGQQITSSEEVYSPGQTIYVYSPGGNYTGAFRTSASVNYRIGSRKEYTSRLQIQIFAKNNQAKPVWVGESITSGPEDDLRVIIDYLISANLKYLGQDTGKGMKDAIRISKKDLEDLNAKP